MHRWLASAAFPRYALVPPSSQDSTRRTCHVARAMTQYPTGTRTALMPWLAIVWKLASVTQVLRWLLIAARSAEVRPYFLAATISCSSPYGDPLTTLNTCAVPEACVRPASDRQDRCLLVRKLHRYGSQRAD